MMNLNAREGELSWLVSGDWSDSWGVTQKRE
jgi:hypothetical protein